MAAKLSSSQQDCIQNVPALLALLKTQPKDQSRPDAIKEARALEHLASAFSTTYDFTSMGGTAVQQISQAFTSLVEERLLKPECRTALREDHLLRVLQVIRLFTRDNNLRRNFVQLGALQELCAVFTKQAELHFTGHITPFQVELLTELASVAKRLAGDDWGLSAMVSSDMHQVLITLLHSTDPAILPLVLVALIGFAAHKDYGALVSQGHVLDVLLRIVADYDLPFKRLAADLLALLARRDSVITELVELNGLGRLVGQLTTGDAPVTASLLRVVCYMASDSRSMQEFYQTGTIPVLLALVSAALREGGVGTPGTQGTQTQGLSSARVADMQLVCTALTRISEDDELACTIRAANGVTLLGKLLLLPAGNHTDPRDQERFNKELSALHAYVLRALRFLFSTERNRKVFKRLFPPDIFAAFIDIGHYNASLAAYQNLVQKVAELSDKAKAALSSALDDISSDREALLGLGEGGGSLRTVRNGQYIVLDMLGKGAYGAVYKAKRPQGNALVALKEVPLSDVGLFGATTSEREQGVGLLSKEVDILSSLSHPHIVQYYESFVEGPYLYIAMELVEGVSLLDHINSLEEKGRRMPEQDIWQVLLAVCLALHYIHGVAKVVHRDLTPANIMLGPGVDGLRHAKIADFGLAKRIQGHVITAQSLVGTMPYTCPEIIQQEHYTAKADVWSLGCVLYHCMMLRPPFDGSNPLSVASKIVEGSYEAVPESSEGPAYSLQLRQLQRLLMTVDPNKRPSMEEVVALVSGQLVTALERLTASEQRLQRALALERAHHRRKPSMGHLLTFLDTPPSPAPGAQPAHTLNNTMQLGANHLGSPMRTPTQQTNGGSTGPTGHPVAGALRTRRHILDPLQPVIPPAPTSNTPLIPAAHSTNSAATATGTGTGGSPLSGTAPATPFAAARTGSDAAMLPAPWSGSTGEAGAAGEGAGVWEPNSGLASALSMGAGGAGGGALGSAPGTPGRVVSLATSRLRPVTDPLTQLLGQLHKIMWVEQQPPGLTRDTRRRCVEAFRRTLFGPGSNATTVKAHLAKLQVGDNDLIRDASGRPVDHFGSGPVGAEGGPAAVTPTDGCLTYEQLAQVVESFLQDKGYWQQPGITATHPYSPMQTLLSRPSGAGGALSGATAAAGAVVTRSPGGVAGDGAGEGALNEQLPPSSFAGMPPAGSGLPRRLSSLRH